MSRPAADEDVFRAVADPTRRAILGALGRCGELSVGELVESIGSSVPLVSRHLAVLRSADLVAERRDGRHRLYRLRPERLRDLYDWAGLFATFWQERITGLQDYLDRRNRRDGSRQESSD